jgi:hypothetical protein
MAAGSNAGDIAPGEPVRQFMHSSNLNRNERGINGAVMN